MASKEMKLVAQGVPPRKLVANLAEMMPGRTKDMIKCIRSRAPYQMIRRTLALVDEVENSQQEEETVNEPETRNWQTEELEAEIRKGLATIRKENNRSEASHFLEEAALAALSGSDPSENMVAWAKYIASLDQEGQSVGESEQRSSNARAFHTGRQNTRRISWKKMQKLWKYDRAAAVEEATGHGLVPREGMHVSSPRGALPTAVYNSRWSYLGLEFGVRGLEEWTAEKPMETLRAVDRAPLTVLQKLEVVRTHFLPGLIHSVVLGRPKKCQLRKLDIAVRKLVRKWFWLPGDSANAYMYGPTGDGGLGLARLETLAPELRKVRIARVKECVFGEEQEGTYETSLERRWNRAQAMHETTDAAELKRSREVGASTIWLRSAHVMAPSWMGRRMIRVHSGSLPSQMRISRGRRTPDMQITCRAGCPSRETAAHVLQVCPSVQLPRNARHNRVCDLLRRSAELRGWKTFSEPHFNLEGRGWRPDLVICVRNGLVAIVDVEVVSGSGQRTLEEMFLTKQAKYSRAALLRAVAALTEQSLESVMVIPAVITWRGVWAKLSAEPLLKLGLPEYVLGWAAERVLLGGGLIWSMFTRNVWR
ncbi:hypothetical protein GE061_007431 [Apolygus lucorum]|uniref:Uncharacterized protein n=1 Tax=Apolygus lucorum TaxID=248454 RepID=A0A8S9WVQ6_APOLU|nr:hypothetical protein GE061_007431 [Apolygus lucorum]